MAPSCRRPMLRLLISILLFYTITTSVTALPQPQHEHQLRQRGSTQNPEVPVTLISGDDSEDFVTKLKKIFNDFLARLVKQRNGDGKENVVHTTYVTVSPTTTSFEAISSTGLVPEEPEPAPAFTSPAPPFTSPVISGRPSFISHQPTALWKNSTKSTPTIVPLSTVSEILFSILPMYPIPSPNLGFSETTTTDLVATLLPLSAFGPGFSVLSASASDSVDRMAQPTARFWSNLTNGIGGATETSVPALIGTGLQSTKTVHITPTGGFSLSPNPGPSGATGRRENGNTTATLYRNYTSTRYVTSTRTVTPIHKLMAASNIPPAITTTPEYLNTSSNPPPIFPPTTATNSILIPIPIPIPSPAAPNPLTRLCSSPNPKNAPLTLPLLSFFYGPSAYPSLHPFPGCTTPNPSQLERAPGLLNCTLLGAQVQACQRLGHRILLSLRASSVTQVGGNLAYGAPGVPSQPFGPTYGPNATSPITPTPNLFDDVHTPNALALTLSSLFAETSTERADLRPLGFDDSLDVGVDWLAKPLGEEVVLDGFDVKVPAEWRGTAQGSLFTEFINRLNELSEEAWTERGATKGGSGDLGADGKGIVLLGWV